MTEIKNTLPALRFPEFTDKWAFKKGKELFSNRRTKTGNALPIYSVTMDRGLIPRDSLEKRIQQDAATEDNLVALPNDIVYNMMRMWQGALGIAYQPCMISPAYVILQPKEGISSEFYALLMKTKRYLYKLESYSYGLTSDRLRLYYKDFSLIVFPVPSLIEQQKIIYFFKVIDNKIELLIKHKFLLERHKRGVMQQIFTQKIRFKDNDNNNFPDWEDKPLGEVIKEPKQVTEKNPDAIELLTVKLHVKGIENSGNFPSSTVNGRPYYRRYENEILIGRQNFHNGGIGIVKNHNSGLICSNAISSYNVVKDNLLFVFYYISRPEYYKRIDDMIGGTGQKEISKSIFEKLNIVLPTLAEQAKIAAFLTILDSKIETINTQLDQTRIYKEALLQRLLV